MFQKKESVKREAMLKPRVQYSLKNARGYFKEHLRIRDYYSRGRIPEGEWIGIEGQETKPQSVG